jgi:hypothetical protein
MENKMKTITASIEPNLCLNCNKELDSVTGIDNTELPKEGSITICLDCGHIMAFDAHIKFRELTDEEMIEIAGNKTILRIQKARGYIKNAATKHHERG